MEKLEKLHYENGVNDLHYISNAAEITRKVAIDFSLWQQRGECKLVIMTTDQNLIKDGVQAIDDEFLEWFCQNSSCEEVEVKWVKTPDGIFYHNDNVPYGCYKIIISKEEPLEESREIIYYCEQGEPTCVYPKCICNTVNSKGELKQEYQEIFPDIIWNADIAPSGERFYYKENDDEITIKGSWKNISSNLNGFKITFKR